MWDEAREERLRGKAARALSAAAARESDPVRAQHMQDAADDCVRHLTDEEKALIASLNGD